MNPHSPLQLERLLFTDVKISAQPDAEANCKMQTAIEFDASVNTQNNRIWQVTMRVHIRGPVETKPPYVGTIECVGLFSVTPEWPEDGLEKLVMVNGTGLLYSAVRELVCNITARGPWPMLLLPTQSFLAAYEQRKKGQKANTLVAS